jgi:hypothetical protein
MTRKPCGISENSATLLERCMTLQPNWFWQLAQDFPAQPVFFKRSDLVIDRIPPSNERVDDFFACIFYLMDVQERPDVPDKIRKHEIQLMFPRLGCKAIDVAFALASGRKRGRPRKN